MAVVTPALRRWCEAFLALIVSFALLVQPAAAQSLSILRDAETEAFFRDASRDLVKAAGLDERSVQFILVGDGSINAFVTGGQNVFIHSGLILAADDVTQLQGVIAHELGHVAGGHGVRLNEGAGPATNISLLSLLLGAAAFAAGAGDAGAAIMMGGQQAAMGKFLGFSRDVENRADQAGARYLDAAGISGRGMVDFFYKLKGEEMRLGYQPDNAYARTHPLTGDRIIALREVLARSPAWNNPPDPQLQARFLRIKGKLGGFVWKPADTLRAFPATNRTVQARYARAYAFHRDAQPDKALAEVDSLLADNPHDPYFLELKGQIMLESGRVPDSLSPLREAVQRSNGEPLIVSTLSQALIATEKPDNMAEAEKLLRVAVARDEDNPFAWYQLGVIYDRRGDQPRAALASAERLSLTGNMAGAKASAQNAMGGLPKGSRDWIRAQDIAMASAGELERTGKGRRRSSSE